MIMQCNYTPTLQHTNTHTAGVSVRAEAAPARAARHGGVRQDPQPRRRQAARDSGQQAAPGV